jgi:hypothetical protein
MTLNRTLIECPAYGLPFQPNNNDCVMLPTGKNVDLSRNYFPTVEDGIYDPFPSENSMVGPKPVHCVR